MMHALTDQVVAFGIKRLPRAHVQHTLPKLRGVTFVDISSIFSEMCICKDLPEMAPKAKSPRSPYRRHLRELSKPRLSRKIVPSARINLNCYWSKFEQLVVMDVAKAAIRSSLDNEINENLANEIRELGN